MKKIIDGRRYDTEAAEVIHEWDNLRPVGDFGRREKTLYRTPNGAFFILHVGGPKTDMAQTLSDNSWTGGRDIEPVSEEDAFAFLCTHGGEGEAEELFPEKIVDA